VSDLTRPLDSLVPPFDDDGADWDDALRRSGAHNRRLRLVAVVAGVFALVAALASTPHGQALVEGAFDRLSAWVDDTPGSRASRYEQELIRKANARSAAPIPDGTELGLLMSKELNGVRFDLLGFRDRGSLCLRLRSSAGDKQSIVRAQADCVSEQLLVDLGKPVAVFSAADPFPRAHVVAAYGLVADRVTAVELEGERGIRRVPAANNAFLYVYRGEGPRLSARDRLDYAADVPFRATALDADGRALGSVRIMSLKRGYPALPPVHKLPGPVGIERLFQSPRVGWLEQGEARGSTYEWRLPDGTTDTVMPRFRSFHPNPVTSLSVLVSRSSLGLSGTEEQTYCLTHVWPLSERPTGMMCAPRARFGAILIQPASAIPFDAQFPVYYGLVADGVESLEFYLANGARETIPVVDNVFALQALVAEPAKLVAYDDEHRVVAIQVVGI
jgi:hypothetical protein